MTRVTGHVTRATYECSDCPKPIERGEAVAYDRKRGEVRHVECEFVVINAMSERAVRT